MDYNHEEHMSRAREYAATIPTHKRAAHYQALYRDGMAGVTRCKQLGLLPETARTMADWYCLTTVLAEMLGPEYVAADAREACREMGMSDSEIAQAVPA